MKRNATKPVMRTLFLLAICLASVQVFFIMSNKASASTQDNPDRIRHVLLLSIDGLYAKLTATKIAEHGGFSEDDTHVALIVANPTLKKGSISTPVQTTQIAPTILLLLHLNPNNLQAVSIENTQILPGL